MEELKKCEIKAEENKEKIFQKYMSFYYIRKNKEKEFKKKVINNKNKEIEKSDKIEEMNRETSKKTEDLIKKLRNIEKKKAEIIKHKNDEFKNINKKRNQYINTCIENKKKILEKLSEDRIDILDYEIQVLNRGMNFSKTNDLQRMNLTEKTILDQQNLEKNLKPFFKRLEMIKSQSIQKKPIEDLKRSYKKKKREEEEAKKKEREEKLLAMGGGS